MFTRSKSTIAAAIAVTGVLLTAAPALAMPLGTTQATPRISHSAYGYVRPESRISQTSLAALEHAVQPTPSLSQASLAALEHALPRATPVTSATLKTPTTVTPHMYLTARAAPGESGSGDAIVALGVVLVATLGTALVMARYLGTGTRKPQSA